ncbi:MAG: hypothetical protein AAF327_22645 [Cyanobacteria bacterium P01_A01_bin.37]
MRIPDEQQKLFDEAGKRFQDVLRIEQELMGDRAEPYASQGVAYFLLADFYEQAGN